MKINLPTQITITRLFLIPAIAIFYLTDWEWGKLIAVCLFVLAAVTDWIDGFIARKYNMVTDFGKLLDPIADKFLTLLGFILIVCDPTLLGKTLPVWLAVTIIFIATARDQYMGTLRLLFANKKIVLAADWYGKIKTATQMIALPLFMFYSFNLNLTDPFLTGIWDKIFMWAALSLICLATVLSAVSALNYTLKFTKALKLKQKQPA
jgi:CDP-diacylglycerol--glycerol-3-phosphate 3-phosphatidyltransferase